MCAICSPNPPHRPLIMVIIFGNEYRLRSSSVCNFYSLPLLPPSHRMSTWRHTVTLYINSVLDRVMIMVETEMKPKLVLWKQE